MAGTMQRSARETWKQSCKVFGWQTKQNKNKVAHSENKEKVGSKENNDRVVAKSRNERITLCTRIRGKRRLESKQSKQTNPIPSHQKGGRQRMETDRASQGQRRKEQGPRRQRKKLIRQSQNHNDVSWMCPWYIITMGRNKRRKNVPAAK